MPWMDQTPYLRSSLPPRTADKGHLNLKPLHLQGVNMNRVKVRGAYHYKPHRHTEYELLIPLRGAYRCTLEGEPLTIRPGRFLFVQEWDRHEDFYREGNEFAAFLFSLHDFGGGRWTHGVFASGAPVSARDIALPKSSRAGALAALILDECKGKGHASVAVEALVEAFFWLVVEGIPEKHLSPPFRGSLGDNAFRRRLLERFAANVREQPRMAGIAAQLGMSERSLDTRCKAVLGTSPARAFASYRIGEAARLLAGGMRVQDAAARLGFADPFHFSKVFKRHLGYPPSAVRGH